MSDTYWSELLSRTLFFWIIGVQLVFIYIEGKKYYRRVLYPRYHKWRYAWKYDKVIKNFKLKMNPPINMGISIDNSKDNIIITGNHVHSLNNE